MPNTSILVPFTDDSTLFFALRMRDLLVPLGCKVTMGWLTDGSALSYRQLQDNLDGGPDIIITNPAFKTPHLFEAFDAIITCRMFAPLRDMVKRRHIKMSANRPVVISFQGGLDFTPERGFANRRHADAVFLVPASDVDRYRVYAENAQFDWQHIGFGHPTFTRRARIEHRLENRDIYFFAQAISPNTMTARLHILDILMTLARCDPTRDVFIKLRHLPGENDTHLHKERFSYGNLLASRPDIPTNLKLTACAMDEAVANAGLGITCTSTSAIDLIREGVPTQVYLDYVENYLDPMVAPMRNLFAGSGIICSLPEILDSTVKAPNPEWIENMLCPPDLGARVLEAIDIVRRDAIRVSEILLPPVPVT